MAEGLFTLLALCIVMACASFLAGVLPLSFSLSSRQLRIISALGTGVLVGTSLIVIIPEGVETLYSATGSSHGHGERSLQRLEVPTGTDRILSAGHLAQPRERTESFPLPITVRVETRFEDGAENFERTPPDDIPAGEHQPPFEDVAPPHASTERNPHAWVGISLISGFILMYLIDTLPRSLQSRPSMPRRFSISLNSFSLNRIGSAITGSAVETPTQENFPSHHSGSSSTTVGLVIHAVADGIALGASSTTTSGLTFIVFLALMIHKAPAAFGLTSVLLKQGLSKRMARVHLIIFALAAPFGAILTWSAVHLLGYNPAVLGERAGAEFATGVMLLFSAGTFLYVAMHTMQENAGSGHAHNYGDAGVQGNGYLGVAGDDMDGVYGPSPLPPVKRDEPGLVDTMVVVAGMLLPLLTQWGHAH